MDASYAASERGTGAGSERRGAPARYVMLSEGQRRDFSALLRHARRLADANRRTDAARVMRIATRVLRGDPLGYE